MTAAMIRIVLKLNLPPEELPELEEPELSVCVLPLELEELEEPVFPPPKSPDRMLWPPELEELEECEELEELEEPAPFKRLPMTFPARLLPEELEELEEPEPPKRLPITLPARLLPEELEELELPPVSMSVRIPFS